MDANDKMGAILAEACLDKDLRNEILTEHLADMKASKSKIKELQDEIESQNKDIDQDKKTISKLNYKLDEANQFLDNFRVREEVLKTAEDEALTLKLTAEFAEARRKDTMHMFMHVTKNPVLTVTKRKETPMYHEGQNGCAGYVTKEDTVDVETTTEE